MWCELPAQAGIDKTDVYLGNSTSKSMTLSSLCIMHLSNTNSQGCVPKSPKAPLRLTHVIIHSSRLVPGMPQAEFVDLVQIPDARCQIPNS